MGYEAAEFFDMPTSEREAERDKFMAHMDSLKEMSNEEHTLYKKWVEVQDLGYMIDKSSLVKANIWRPRDILDKEKTLEDLGALEPEIIYVPVTDKELTEKWLLLRTFCSTMEFEQNPGRFLRFIVQDKVTGKYLGVASVGSDVISIAVRDQWIGWTEEQKINQGLLRYSAIATTLVPTQPFGFNFLGGKLTAAMITTPIVANAWKETYGETLVGITTTSLYGAHSMYQRIPFWKELGETTGRVMLKPDDKFYEFWHHWIQENKKQEYADMTESDSNGPVTGIKQKILTMIMKELRMKQSSYMHGFQRGVYYAPLYENTREFLRGEITEGKLIPIKKLENGADSVIEWWKPKAINRYLNVLKDGRVTPDILFYNRMIGMQWKEAKEHYLKEVGR
jgi:hypothetical protein